jgi:hypothetical protein
MELGEILRRYAAQNDDGRAGALTLGVGGGLWSAWSYLTLGVGGGLWSAWSVWAWRYV